MIKIFEVPVIVTKNDGFDITYEAEGVADYWTIKSKEYDNEEDALEDIKAKLQKEFQKDADTWGTVEIEEDNDLDLDEDQKIVTLEIPINIDEDED